MIDRDLAELYGVETKHLNRQVKRNKERFPSEFMFRLTKKEKHELNKLAPVRRTETFVSVALCFSQSMELQCWQQC
jgi:hypothetical protein